MSSVASADRSQGEARFELLESQGRTILRVCGDWTVWTVGGLDAELRSRGGEAFIGAQVDVSQLGELDIAGAYLIDRTVRGGSPCGHTDAPQTLLGAHPTAERLLRATRAAARPCPVDPKREPGLLLLLERAGRGVLEAQRELMRILSFVGETLATIAGLLVQPQKIRWANTFTVMESAGLNALPIIATLAFFIGIVIAYLGARILQDFGATIFTVELVSYSILREFAVVITSVLLAGRTASSFTAELGSMKMRQEIDAMRVMGLSPMQALVAPRVVAMIFMAPLLTFLAMLAGLGGGMLVAWAALNISPVLFLTRIQDAIPPQSFAVGMLKAPVFAFMIAAIGCRHGLETGNDVGSLGRRVTTSVVQSIFFVVLLDAFFALWFLEIGW